MFAGIVSIQVNTDSDEEARQVGDVILGRHDPRMNCFFERFASMLRIRISICM